MEWMDIRILLAIIFCTSGLVICNISLLVLIFLYHKKQLSRRYEKIDLKSQFMQEILNSQIAVQGSTIRYVGQELHDNVGQLLSVAKINLNILEDSIVDSENQEYIKQTNDLVGQTILDLRILTKNLNDHFLQQFDLQENIAQELQRIRRSKSFETEITLDGDVYTLGYEYEIVLFRIFQEFLDHSIKYSGAKNINVKLSYGDQSFNLYLTDDGKEFVRNELDFNKIGKSIAGIDNIRRRCVLIGGKFNYESNTGKGIKINIELPNPNYNRSTV